MLSISWQRDPPFNEWLEIIRLEQPGDGPGSTMLAMWTMKSGQLSPFLSIPGFQHGTISYDWMHNIYLGVARDLIASALKLMITKGIWGDVTNDDWDSVLAAIHFEMHQACAKQGSLGSNMFQCFFVCMPGLCST